MPKGWKNRTPQPLPMPPGPDTQSTQVEETPAIKVENTGPSPFFFVRSGLADRFYNAASAHTIEVPEMLMLFGHDNDAIGVPADKMEALVEFLANKKDWLHLSGEKKWVRMEPVYILHTLLPGSIGITFESGRQLWSKNVADQTTLLGYLRVLEGAG